MSEYGLLSEVVAEPRGSFLAIDAAATDTELVIEYAGDFAPEGGTLDLNGVRLEYTTITDGANPDDPDTLTLAVPLTAGADEGDIVSVVLGGQVAVDYVAHVGTDDGDQVSVPLRYDQLAGWPVGIYDPPVPVTMSEDLERLEDAPGRQPLGSATSFRNTDSASASGPGDIDIALTYVPIEGSEHVYVGPLYQPPSEWTRSGSVVTLLDPDDHLRSGDVVSVSYAYPEQAVEVIEALDWGSSGPYKVVSEGNATDYSSPGYDDSSWLSGAGPVGSPLGINAGQPSWPGVLIDTGSVDSGLWMRRVYTTPAGGLLVSARVDGQFWLYVDGSLIAADPANDATLEVGPILVPVAAGDHVIALHVNDDTADPPLENIYGDLRAEMNQ